MKMIFDHLIQNQMEHTHKKHEEIPGGEKPFKKEVLEMATSSLQSFNPINNIHMYFCGIHTYAEDPNRQVIAHHFCSHPNNDFHQCVIYDKNDSSGKLIGIEYIISRRLYMTLTEEEKKYWHSHVFEVKGGLLAAPNIPTLAENELMKELVQMYGKTIHTWQYDKYDLPIGPPKLMMALANERQINQETLEKSYKEIPRLPREKLILDRENIESPQVDPMADYWTTHDKIPIFDRIEVDVIKK